MTLDQAKELRLLIMAKRDALWHLQQALDNAIALGLFDDKHVEIPPAAVESCSVSPPSEEPPSHE